LESKLPASPEASATPELERGLSARAALGINIIDMVGVGPFVTLPLIVIAMGGPQAMLGWLLGAVLSLCDGLVWSELGTTYPEAGGSYVYLRKLYGERGLGQAVSFLYAWQLLFSAPLSIASGCLGFSQYMAYFFPRSGERLLSFTLLQVPVVFSSQTLMAMALCCLAMVILYRKIGSLDKLMRALGAAVVLALVAIIVTGLTHFHAALAFDFPPGAFHLGPAFFAGLGAGMLISAYDYWGYYNVCFLGAEVQNPRRTIPLAVLGSITIVGTLYLLMNISVLGVIPWHDLTGNLTGDARMYTMAVFMQRAYGAGALGHTAAISIVVLVALAASASVLALLLGYSRIPYAAAKSGNFPTVFAKVHPKHRIPHVSLLTLGGMTLFCCLFRLQEVITTLVVIRILFQFLLQGIAVLLPRHRRARKERGQLSFRMPLYPLPVVFAMCGFVFILFSRANFLKEMRTAGVILAVGAVVYGVRMWRGSKEIVEHQSI
jgi:amino acid transporter